MKSYPAPPIPESIVNDMQQRVDAGASAPELIEPMRAAGLNIIASNKLLRRFFNLSYSEAKQMIHLSPTWSDCRKSNDALHDAAFQSIEEYAAAHSASGDYTRDRHQWQDGTTVDELLNELPPVR